jgi:N-acetylmuramoyl-L-alanine amidase
MLLAVLMMTGLSVGSVGAAAAERAAEPETAGGQVAVLAARLGEHEDHTRLVLELTAPVGARIHPGPARNSLQLLLPGAVWQASVPPKAGKGLVRQLTVGRREPASVLTIQGAKALKVRSLELIPPQDGFGPRLVVALVQGRQSGGVSAVFVQAAVSNALTPEQSVPDSGPGSDRVRAPVADPLQRVRASLIPPGLLKLSPPSESSPSTSSAESSPAKAVTALLAVPSNRLPPRPPSRRPMIVIDAGHGGADPGATAVNGALEKDLTLSMARELRRQLLATGRYRVNMTRDSDAFVPLRTRVSRAREQNADLFLSLHADTIGRATIRGLSVYTLSERATDREAEMLAQRENRADAIVGMNLSAESRQVASILIDLSQRDTGNQSRALARHIVDEAGREVPLLVSPLRSAGFAVLTAPDVPSVLVEMGYLSHPADAKLLSSQKHRQRLSAGLVRAIDSYFSRTLVASRS